MPLLKIWNSLLGRSNNESSPAGGQAEATEPEGCPPSTVQVAKPAGQKPKKKSGRGILGLGNRGPHATLCKQLRSLQVSTVLEITVDDGTRAAAVLSTLGRQNQQIRYAAIDQFELSGGPITLKAFHQSLRAEDVRPQIFPDSIERGLVRVSSTIGAIDLVLIGADLEVWQKPAVLALLPRILHPHSLVLYRSEEAWIRYESAKPAARAA
jgi:hypothetical protein